MTNTRDQQLTDAVAKIDKQIRTLQASVFCPACIAKRANVRAALEPEGIVFVVACEACSHELSLIYQAFKMRGIDIDYRGDDDGFEIGEVPPVQVQ